MVKYDAHKSPTEVEGCVISIDVTWWAEGEVEQETIDKLDGYLAGGRFDPDGQRIMVNTTGRGDQNSVLYVYQRPLDYRAIRAMWQKIDTYMGFDRFSLKMGTEVVSLRERE